MTKEKGNLFSILDKADKTMKIKNVLILLLVISSSGFADIREHSPRISAVLDWELGGAAVATAPTKVTTIPILDFGIEWNVNMECGNFDMSISVANQLNGVTEGFRNMLANIVASAKGAIASLPALAIQRASPELYDMLQQGILQGKLDFAAAELSCEDMQGMMMGEKAFPWEEYKLSAEAGEWKGQIAGSKGSDAVAVKKKATEAKPEDKGTEWACGEKRGGKLQPPIKSINDIVITGYNVLFDRSNKCDTGGMPSSTSAPLFDYWPSSQKAADFATEVVGDIEVRMCDGCKKLESKPGRGLTYMHEDTTKDMTAVFSQLASGSLAMDWVHLKKVSAPPAIKVTPAIIYSIQKRTTAGQQNMIEKLAGEIAYARIMEQGRMLIQMLRSGMKEPNIAKFPQPVKAAQDAIVAIESELKQLELEVQVKKAVASKTLVKILGREEQGIQESSRSKKRTTNSVTPYGQL